MNKDQLVALWEEHIADEFKTRDTEATLATMVPDAYVNHVPVMTGGNGIEALRAFYSSDSSPSCRPTPRSPRSPAPSATTRSSTR